MKKIVLFFLIFINAYYLSGQVSSDEFTKQCKLIGLQFTPSLVQTDFKPITLDSAVSKQYDYAIISNDSKIEYRYRLFPSLKDSAGAAFGFKYFLFEAAKIKAGYPDLQIKPYPEKTVADAYGASGGYSTAFKPGDWMATNFTSCSCFAFYKEGRGGFIIYMLTNDNKILLQEKYAAGLVGVLMFK